MLLIWSFSSFVDVPKKSPVSTAFVYGAASLSSSCARFWSRSSYSFRSPLAVNATDSWCASPPTAAAALPAKVMMFANPSTTVASPCRIPGELRSLMKPSSVGNKSCATLLATPPNAVFRSSRSSLNLSAAAAASGVTTPPRFSSLLPNSSKPFDPELRNSVSSNPDLPNNCCATAAFCTPSGRRWKASAILGTSVVRSVKSSFLMPSAANSPACCDFGSSASAAFFDRIFRPFCKSSISVPVCLAA